LKDSIFDENILKVMCVPTNEIFKAKLQELSQKVSNQPYYLHLLYTGGIKDKKNLINLKDSELKEIFEILQNKLNTK